MTRALLCLILLLLIPILVGCQDRPPTPTVATTTSEATRLATVTPASVQTRDSEHPAESTVALPSPAVVIKSPTATSMPTPSSATPEPTATVNYPAYTGPPLNRADAGIQIHLHREDLDGLLTHISNLGLGWVKTQVSWKLYQPDVDRFDDFRWAELDRLIEGAEKQGLRVMLSVAKAPEWSRPTTELDGPP